MSTCPLRRETWTIAEHECMADIALKKGNYIPDSVQLGFGRNGSDRTNAELSKAQKEDSKPEPKPRVKAVKKAKSKSPAKKKAAVVEPAPESTPEPETVSAD
jgi:hypothetical protein